MGQAIQRILVATDFSDAARAALDRAAALARQHAAELRLVHAFAPGDGIGSAASPVHPDLAALVAKAAAAALQSECARIAPVHPAHGELVEGVLHRVLADLLDAYPAELMAMGTRGAAGWRDALLGSTCDRVLRLHRLPVLLVRGDTSKDYGRVAIATDLSPASAAAARFGLRLTPSATHLLLHACEPEFFGSLAFAGVSQEAIDAYRGEAAQEAMAALDAFIQRLGDDAHRLVPALREGRASRVLSAFVEQADVDLAVVGTSGRSGIERGLLGSVSRHASAGLPCDVLVVPEAANASQA